MENLSKLRNAVAEICVKINPNIVLTLGAGRSINEITFEGKIRHFVNTIQRTHRGRNWHSLPRSMWPKAIGLNEKRDTNPHMHLAVYAPEDLIVYFVTGRSRWSAIRPTGDYFFDYIDSPEKYSRYITKKFYIPSTRDHVFLYP